MGVIRVIGVAVIGFRGRVWGYSSPFGSFVVQGFGVSVWGFGVRVWGSGFDVCKRVFRA